MKRFKAGDMVTVVSVVPDHPSANWHRSNGTLGMTYKVLKVINQEEGGYLLSIPNAPMDFDIFWWPQLEAA